MTIAKKTIHQRMARIMKACDGIIKSNTSDQGYKFRGVDDAYNYLHDLLVREGVFTVPRVLDLQREERLSSRNKTLIYTIIRMEFDFVSEEGDLVTVGPMIGEAMDSGDKSSNKCQSIAHKMALFQVFMIPTLLSADTAEGEQHEIASPGDNKIPPANDDVPGDVLGKESTEPKILMASKGQWATLKNYQKLGATTGEMNEYIRNKAVSLTAKQANQLINKIEEGIDSQANDEESK